ncbi:hypothetical protein [Dermacoccus nishinomiyaensis]|uniref:hypothetical protein n=1 Tax=Dermacoccus nishinomiyaensis TaxID=1274 RepID=UPI00248DB362|nr:hypothetical protein [Dermacoccus nishinomiyaensis]
MSEATQETVEKPEGVFNDRAPSEETVQDLIHQLAVQAPRELTGYMSDLEFGFTQEERKLFFNGEELRLFDMDYLYGFLGMPVSYCKKRQPDEQQVLLKYRVGRMEDDVRIKVMVGRDGEVEDIVRHETEFLSNSSVVNALRQVLGDNAMVRDFDVNSKETILDVYAVDARYGGGVQDEDEAYAGVRVRIPRKGSRTPVLTPLIHLERYQSEVELDADEDAKIHSDQVVDGASDLQGSLFVQVKHAARLCLAEAMGAIPELYSSQRLNVGGVEDALGDTHKKLAIEALDVIFSQVGSSRYLAMTRDHFASQITEKEKVPSVFDIVVFMAQVANYKPRSPLARTCQQAAGSMIGITADKCPTCQQRI